jgi:DNA-binding NarL/FixJ family response regulator
MARIRILLADDHALVRAGFRSLLETFEGTEVVGEAGEGDEALRLIAELRPDVALLDISMPGLNGLEVTARATVAHPRVRIIMLSMHNDDEYIRRAFRAGASGYLLKNSERHELEMAVRAVARGEGWLSPAVSKKVIASYGAGGAFPADGAEPLTPRQRQVLQLIAEGLSTKEIATRLDLSVKTVESHRMQLMERLDLHNVAGLVRYAIRLGIVRAEP